MPRSCRMKRSQAAVDDLLKRTIDLDISLRVTSPSRVEALMAKIDAEIEGVAPSPVPSSAVTMVELEVSLTRQHYAFL